MEMQVTEAKIPILAQSKSFFSSCPPNTRPHESTEVDTKCNPVRRPARCSEEGRSNEKEVKKKEEKKSKVKRSKEK